LLRRIFDAIPAWAFFALAALLLGAGIYAQLELRGPEKPLGRVQDLRSLASRERPLNVVFIVIDMLRADRLSAYGYHRDTSPVMEDLASRGILFQNVESQSSWTKASMASMWTGLYPERVGVKRFFHALPTEAKLPAEIFKEAGYRTGGIWRNGWVAPNFQFNQGFDLYLRPQKYLPPGGIKRRQNPSAHPLQGTDYDATSSAIEFMQAYKDEPFFLYIHYMDVHQYLYADISPEYGSSLSDIYDSSIFWTDKNIEYFMQALVNLGLADDTLVVIASDHGESFFEHGIEGHARQLYNETGDVPLIFVPPFDLDPGIVVETQVANVDVWPTILDLVGLEGLVNPEGRSLVPLMEAAAAGQGGAEDSGVPVFAQLDRSWGQVDAESNPQISVLKEPYRLLYNETAPEQIELFDHTQDPGEQRNLASDQPEIAAELVAEIEAFKARDSPGWETAPEVEIDEMRIHQLRALGYVIEAGKAPKPPPAVQRRQAAEQRRRAAEANSETESAADPGSEDAAGDDSSSAAGP